MYNEITKEHRMIQDKELRKFSKQIDKAEAYLPYVLTVDILESVDVIEVDFSSGGSRFAGIKVEHSFGYILLDKSSAPIAIHALFQDKLTGNWHLMLAVQFART